jgi:hypothetical protein
MFVVEAVAIGGLSLLQMGARRRVRFGRDARSGLRQSRRETAFAGQVPTTSSTGTKPPVA